MYFSFVQLSSLDTRFGVQISIPLSHSHTLLLSSVSLDSSLLILEEREREEEEEGRGGEKEGRSKEEQSRAEQRQKKRREESVELISINKMFIKKASGNFTIIYEISIKKIKLFKTNYSLVCENKYK